MRKHQFVKRFNTAHAARCGDVAHGSYWRNYIEGYVLESVPMARAVLYRVVRIQFRGKKDGSLRKGANLLYRGMVSLRLDRHLTIKWRDYFGNPLSTSVCMADVGNDREALQQVYDALVKAIHAVEHFDEITY